MIWAKLNKDGTISMPMTAEDDDHIGDGMVILKPGDKGYDEALVEAKQH